ncbi:MAG: prepilin-type N-terminal cleavage/methylation domain-containing protein [Opitutaceae bacterium]|jgi:prepilin-type N-terminal cleavage/methylation domain-containing protein/prepilin-type processing-associated H-X9-DG protein|nr:prepilin-type N-terminal cleavage/methylation domain-containing protein [Opitutaceae bacterium]
MLLPDLTMQPACPRKCLRTTAAFTLIELLTVVAIIGILAAITIPVTGSVRDKARTARCAGNVRELARATLLYTADHKDMLPRLDFHWAEDLWPYAGNGRIYVAFGGDELPEILKDTICECPVAHRDTVTPKRSYAANLQIASGAGATHVPLRTVTSPSATVMFADAQGTSSLSVNALNPRHDKKFNASFFDGHVKLLPKTGADIMDTNYKSTFWKSP